jgi:low temperature requirement protein LtrA
MPSTPPRPAEFASRVSTLELFFDLVFVFTITQVTELIIHATAPLDALKALLVLMMTWWMYGGYAWLTNNVGTDQPLNRVLVLLAMGGFLVMALAIPQAFGAAGLIFGCAYLLVNLIHAALFTRAPNLSSARAIWRIAPFNVGTALLIVLAGLINASWSWVLWVAAAGILASTPLFGTGRGFAVSPAHFVERHGLVIIIALGESVVAIGIGAASAPLTGALLVEALLTLALIAALWWCYFDRDDQQAERGLASVDGPARSRMALYAFGHAHLLLIAGVVLLSAGIKQHLEELHQPITLAAATVLGLGVALYLFGDVLFRRLVKISPSRLRLGAALLALALIPLGRWVSGLAEIAALLGLLIAMLALEHAVAKRQSVARI